MSLTTENDANQSLTALKNQLTDFCQTHAISRWEPAEILELLQDGEDISWLREQLFTGDNATVALELENLLRAIQALVHPQVEETSSIEPDFGAVPEPEIGGDLPQAALEKMTDEDLRELLAEQGIKLPPGMALKKLKEIMGSPQGTLSADFALFCQAHGVQPNVKSKSNTKAMEALREIWLDTPREMLTEMTPREFMAMNPDTDIPQKVSTYKREAPKVGRNDPCPCGSGKKYKKCHGQGE
ncbi:SEC-C domain-containing protein [candidate division KSB1 bacterium]|nr:SEC-C domain-containing protein [candidate division KSB1 bacterium]